MRKSESLKDSGKTFSIGRLRSYDYELEPWLIDDCRYIQAAIFSLPIKPSGILGLEFLANFYAEHGSMNPSIASIAEYAKFKTHAATKKMLMSLQTDGFLLIADNFDPVPSCESTRRTVYSYTLTKNIRFHYEKYLVRKRVRDLESYLCQWFLTKSQKCFAMAELDELFCQHDSLEASIFSLNKKLEFLGKESI